MARSEGLLPLVMVALVPVACSEAVLGEDLGPSSSAADLDEVTSSSGTLPDWPDMVSTDGSTTVLYDQNLLPWDRRAFEAIVNVKPQGPGWGGRRIYLNGVVTEHEKLIEGPDAGQDYRPPVQITFLNTDSSQLDPFLSDFFDTSLFDHDTPLHRKLLSIPIGLPADHSLKVTIPRPQAGVTLITRTTGVQMNTFEGQKHIGGFYDSRDIGHRFLWQDLQHGGSRNVVNIAYQYNVSQQHVPSRTFTSRNSRVRVELHGKNRVFGLYKEDEDSITTLSSAFALTFRHKNLDATSGNVNASSRSVPLRIQLGLRLMQKRGRFIQFVHVRNLNHPHVVHKSPANTSDPTWCNDRHPCEYLTGLGAQTDSEPSSDMKRFVFEVSHDQLKALLAHAGYPDLNPQNYFVEYGAITNETHLFPGDYSRAAFSYGGLKIELRH